VDSFSNGCFRGHHGCLGIAEAQNGQGAPPLA
jgi:hypothetical protein